MQMFHWCTARVHFNLIWRVNWQFVNNNPNLRPTRLSQKIGIHNWHVNYAAFYCHKIFLNYNFIPNRLGYLIASPTTFRVKYLIIFFITNFIGKIIFAITETFSISLHSWIWPPGNTWPVIMFPSPARFVGRPLGPNAAPTHDKIFASLCLYLCKLPRIVYLDWNDWTLIFAEITFCFRSKMKNVWKLYLSAYLQYKSVED